MKEFEKWYEKMIRQNQQEAKIVAEADLLPAVKAAAKYSWKAALEWVYSQRFKDSFEQLHAWEKNITKEDKKVIATSIIRKELNE